MSQYNVYRFLSHALIKFFDRLKYSRNSSLLRPADVVEDDNCVVATQTKHRLYTMIHTPRAQDCQLTFTISKPAQN